MTFPKRFLWRSSDLTFDKGRQPTDEEQQRADAALTEFQKKLLER